MRTWEKLNISLDKWNNMEGIEKINLLKKHNINVDIKYYFGKEYKIKYPEDIYMFHRKKKLLLDNTLLEKIKNLTKEKKEFGGTIRFDENKLDILFIGNENNIELNLEKDTQILFHTHPFEKNLKYRPPSVLDIISFLVLNIKSIAELIIDLSQGIEHPIDEELIVENSIVFTQNEVYVYYISYPLLVNINKYLIKLFKTNKDFIYSVEKFLELIELEYSMILYSFNKNLNNYEIEEYLKKLSSLGILMKRFKYNEYPETYN
jgi:hypothetical protein